MILTAHQPVYLPWLGLFHKIALADKFVSFNQVQYLPKDWNNRNKIRTPNGSIWLTVPVLSSNYREKKLVEIEIDNSQPWQRKHWQSIFINYKKAPFFSQYSDFFESVYQKEWTHLCQLNDYMLCWFLKELGINTEFLDAGDFNFQGKKNDLVLDMCLEMKADVYIFGSLGKDYAEVESFEEKGIQLAFQDYQHPEYQQLNRTFEPYMSIIDLLFNHGSSSLDVLMSGNISKDRK